MRDKNEGENASLFCPACSTEIAFKYDITESSGIKVPWYICACGTIFHKNKIKKDFYLEGYDLKYKDSKRIAERFNYFIRSYLPLVEEMTHGRKFLDVGFTLDYNIVETKKRGWIATGIDVFDNPYIVGDFEKYDFRKEKFDFIKFGHVLEIFDNPVSAIAKAADLLNQNGVLYVACVDGEAIWHVGMQNFGHWNSQERWFYPSERQFSKIASALQLDVIMLRKNFGQRFTEWNDFHAILQKNRV